MATKLNEFHTKAPKTGKNDILDSLSGRLAVMAPYNMPIFVNFSFFQGVQYYKRPGHGTFNLQTCNPTNKLKMNPYLRRLKLSS